jgi:hypothetical protein
MYLWLHSKDAHTDVFGGLFILLTVRNIDNAAMTNKTPHVTVFQPKPQM